MLDRWHFPTETGHNSERTQLNRAQHLQGLKNSTTQQNILINKMDTQQNRIYNKMDFSTKWTTQQNGLLN